MSSNTASSFPVGPHRRPRLSYTRVDQVGLQFNDCKAFTFASAAAGRMPSITEDRDLRDTWLMRTPIAHRGLHAAAEGRPENSLAAFERACRLGFPAELDLRLTGDGQVVVFHDRALRRLTGARGRIEDRDVADLRGLRLLRTSQRIPLLDEVLALVDGRVPLLLELKAGAPPTALEAAVLDALRGYRGEVAIQSFELRTVRELDRCKAPHAVGQLWRRRGPAAAGDRVAFVGCHVDGAPRRAVQRRREAGGVVLAWTVRSPEQAERALCFVDNYIFEGFVPELPAAHPVTAPETARRAAR